jgi:FixJ family two-component response regulator
MNATFAMYLFEPRADLFKTVKAQEIVALIGVVDDDESVRESISSLLRSAGYQSVLFPSAEAFLASGVVEQPDCLVLDVKMPGLSGLELQQRLFEVKRPKPIVFVTGHADDEVRDKALKQGAVAFLNKPFSDEDLLGAINSALHPPGQGIDRI